MFLVQRSPKGGNKLGSFLTKRKMKGETFDYAANKRAEIVDDFYCFKVGYCNGCAQELYIKQSTAKRLTRLLKRAF